MSAIDQELISKVNQVLQLYPASVTRLCSTEAHNKAIGGAKNSFHLTGEAIDLIVDNPTCLANMAKYAVQCGFGGVEVDLTNSHIHLDVRKTDLWHVVKTKDDTIPLTDYLTRPLI